MSDENEEGIVLPVKAPSGLWGEWRFPPGRSPVGCNISECTFLGMLYREARPPNMLTCAQAERDEWMRIVESDLTRIATTNEGPLGFAFVTLVPLTWKSGP